jgi:methyl-accepting chemotaxis protein
MPTARSVPTEAVSNRNSIRFRLFAALGGISLTSCVAGAIAWTSLGDVQRTFDDVAHGSMPVMVSALELAAESAALSAAGTEIAGATSDAARGETVKQLGVRNDRIRSWLEELNKQLSEQGQAKISAAMVDQTAKNMAALSDVMATILEARQASKTLLGEVDTAHEAIIKVLAGQADDRLFEIILEMQGADKDPIRQGQRDSGAIVNGMMNTVALLKAESNANAVQALLHAAAQISDVTYLQPTADRFTAATEALTRSLKELSDSKIREAVAAQVNALIAHGSGENGLFAIKARELGAQRSLGAILTGNRQLAEQIRSRIQGVVQSSRDSVASGQTTVERSVQRGNQLILVVVAASIVISVLVGWLYVGRKLARPLVEMTNVMSRLAGGDQEAEIPALGRKDEIGEMARSLTTIRDTGVRAARVQTALDNTAGVVLLIDPAGAINYANAAARRYFAKVESDVRMVVADFAADRLLGAEFGPLLGDRRAAARLAEITDARTERFGFGGRMAELTLNPIVSDSGGRLGTVVEWVDLTEQLAVESEVAGLVEASVAGDFSRRVELSNKTGFMLKLGEGMNRWAQTVAAALTEVVDMMSGLARGDLTKRISGEYQGDLLRLKRDCNETADQLANIVGQTVEGMQTIRSATAQLTTGSSDLSVRTEEQVSNLEEMAAAIRQLSATIKQNADNAQQANQLATAARQAAEGGGDIAGSAVKAMGRIEESSRRIAEIVGMIDEIAFQTNLLALNAAVEAARAGDAGRGFAVVASEVRALAQRSGAASKEIKALVAASSQNTKEGVELVNRAGSSLSEITGSVKRVADIVSEMAAANREQSAGVAEVENTVGQMESVTQKNAQLVEESGAALTSVDQQAEELATLVKFFSVGERHTAGGTATPSAASAFRSAASRNAEAKRRDARQMQSKLADAVGGDAAAGESAASDPVAASPKPLRRQAQGSITDWSEF